MPQPPEWRTQTPNNNGLSACLRVADGFVDMFVSQLRSAPTWMLPNPNRALEVSTARPGETRIGNSGERTACPEALQIHGKWPERSLPSVVMPEHGTVVGHHFSHLYGVVPDVRKIVCSIDKPELYRAKIRRWIEHHRVT